MDDALPRRNLGQGEHWGRTLETRQARVQKQAGAISQVLSGDSRNTAAELAMLQRQADELKSDLLAMPIARQASGFASNFSIAPSWTTAVSLNFVVPPRKTSANIIARASANVDWTAAQSGGGERFNWPFSLGDVTKEYGPDPMYQDGMHKGIDFGIAGGTPIIAPGTGTVTTKSYDGERGNYIIIDHGDGLTTWYYHLQAPSPLSVGSSVTKGSTVVGYVGTTGLSTGNHLHWETRVNGNHMNPRNFMDQYANSGSSSIPFDFMGRIIIASNSIHGYRGSRDPVSGDIRIYGAGGLTFPVTPGLNVGVSFQLISTNGLSNPAFTDTFGSLTAFGVFS